MKWLWEYESVAWQSCDSREKPRLVFQKLEPLSSRSSSFPRQG